MKTAPAGLHEPCSVPSLPQGGARKIDLNNCTYCIPKSVFPLTFYLVHVIIFWQNITFNSVKLVCFICIYYMLIPVISVALSAYK